MRIKIGLLAAALLVSGAWVVAQESLPSGSRGPAGAQGGSAPLPPATTPVHHSYAIGYDLGASFRSDQIELDVDALVAGIRDALAGGEPKYSAEICGAAMEKLNAQRLEVIRRRNLEFLEKNQSQPNVQVTSTGLQYVVLKEGKGASPTAQDVVRTNYTGRLIDGTVFDSTEGGEPAQFPVSRVIPGWTEALQKMKVGDKWRIFVPANLAYGEEGGGGGAIPPHSTLIFDLELVEIVQR